MPTYEYKCSACGHRFELFQSMTERPKRKCPSCSKNTAERLIGTGAAILFKGSGFYQTDYRSDSYKKAAEAESKPDAAPAAPAADAKAPAAPEPTKPKSEPKPAAKAKTKPKKSA